MKYFTARIANKVISCDVFIICTCYGSQYLQVIHFISMEKSASDYWYQSS